MAGVCVALLAVLGAAGLASPAHADPAPSGGAGWIRLAHLSPDTPAVNVALTGLGGSKQWVKLRNVGYGDVSGYQRVPAGVYVATMTPAGGSAHSQPAISQAVTVKAHHAYTVAAMGRHAHLTGRVLPDDLTPPTKGTAKVRLVQASTNAPVVTVTATGGPVLAKKQRFASATGYAEVPAGVWTITIDPVTTDPAKDGPATGGSAQGNQGNSRVAPVTTKITARAGSVDTIFVLDGPGDTITAKTITDASGAASMPTRHTGVQTGEGGAALPGVTHSAGAGLAAGALLLIAAYLAAGRLGHRRPSVRG